MILTQSRFVPKSSLFGQMTMTLGSTQILGVPTKVWTRSRREPMSRACVRHRYVVGLAHTFQASLNNHSPVLSSNLQTLILGGEYELVDHNEYIGYRNGRPLVKTTRREMQPIKIVRGVGDEVVVCVLDETSLHRAPSTNREGRDDREPITFKWANSTLTSTMLPSSKPMAYLP